MNSTGLLVTSSKQPQLLCLCFFSGIAVTPPTPSWSVFGSVFVAVLGRTATGNNDVPQTVYSAPSLHGRSGPLSAYLTSFSLNAHSMGAR